MSKQQSKMPVLNKNDMKNKIILILFILPFLGACLGESTRNHEKDDISLTNNQDSIPSSTPHNKTMCFLKLDGTQSQDSTYVYIQLKGDSVSGLYNWIPDMKDSRRGIINGIKRGDTINVVWSYMQEGIIDTIYTQFLLEDNKLKQQPYLTREDGRQVRDRNASFEIVYNSIGCPIF